MTSPAPVGASVCESGCQRAEWAVWRVRSFQFNGKMCDPNVRELEPYRDLAAPGRWAPSRVE